jgi:hypothetical protein
MLKNDKMYQNISSVDLFMIDLVLMREAKWLFQWGISEVHGLVNQYLRRQVTPTKITYLDGKLVSSQLTTAEHNLVSTNRRQ